MPAVKHGGGHIMFWGCFIWKRWTRLNSKVPMFGACSTTSYMEVYWGKSMNHIRIPVAWLALVHDSWTIFSVNRTQKGRKPHEHVPITSWNNRHVQLMDYLNKVKVFSWIFRQMLRQFWREVGGNISNVCSSLDETGTPPSFLSNAGLSWSEDCGRDKTD